MFDVKSLISRELDGDENLLWYGQPRQGLFLRGSDVFMIPFSLMWGGFAIFWEYSVLQGGAPGFFALWGIPFVAIGLYMIFGRFFFEAKQRKNTFYGVTDKRIIILSGIFSKHSKSLAVKLLSDISLKEKKNGIGSVILGQENPMAGFMAGSSWPGGKNPTPRLDNIPDSKKVYDIVRGLRE